MGEMEKELRSISKTLNELARKLDQVAAKAVGRPKVVARARKKPTRKAQPRKTGPEVIMALIKARKNGMDTATLRARTGLDGQRVRSIVWELSKKGKIKRVAKGLYKIA
jgi:predicted transcriptional regulator